MHSSEDVTVNLILQGVTSDEIYMHVVLSVNHPCSACYMKWVVHQHVTVSALRETSAVISVSVLVMKQTLN